MTNPLHNEILEHTHGWLVAHNLTHHYLFERSPCGNLLRGGSSHRALNRRELYRYLCHEGFAPYAIAKALGVGRTQIVIAKQTEQIQ